MGHYGVISLIETGFWVFLQVRLRIFELISSLYGFMLIEWAPNHQTGGKDVEIEK